MGSTTHIEISHRRSRSPSVASHEDDLHENGVQVSPAEVSPPFSVIHPQSQSGSSSHPGDYVHLEYPNEIHDRGDLHPSDSASRLDSHERGPPRTSRSSSIRRTQSHPHHPPRDPARPRGREVPEASPTESGDSTEEFLSRPDPGGMPRPKSYYGPNGYTHSSSSGSYYPPHNQIVPAQHPHQPPPHPYPQQYPPPMGAPPPMGYPAPPNQMSFQPQYHHPPSQVSSPYSSPYGPPSIMHYPGPTSGYFTPQYGQPFPQQYPPHYMQYPPQHLMHIPPYGVDAYRVQSPAAQPQTSPPASEASSAKINEEEIIKRMEALMKAQTDERSKSEVDREAAMKQAMEQAKAEAQAAADRAAAEAKIREEARLEAIKAYEEKTKAAAEQAAREQQIRKEATEAALKAAAEEAAAKAERAAQEKKIADEAAAAAKTAAEKEAAEAAAAAEKAAKAAQEDAEQKLKDAEKTAKEAQEEAEKKLKAAEEEAAKAKADAEAAEKKAADAAPPEKKKPVRFKDAIGRNYNFPFERCCRWRDMEGLINQAFAHVQNLAEHVHNRNYDLLGPNEEIIMPQYWDSTVEPDMHITMKLWPLPDPKKDEELEPVPPPDDDGILNLDDILNSGGGGRKREGGGGGSKKKRPTSRGPGALGMWMLGGAPKKGHLKGDKKPDVAAGSQHGATEGSCIVM